MRRFVLGALIAFPIAVAPDAGAQSLITVDDVVASGFSRPVYVTSAGDGSGRLFVVEQSGRILTIESGTVLATPFLDIRSLVSSAGEQGLLSVAFHPRYATNGWFYVNYTDLSGATVVARYSVSGDPNRADPSSAAVLLHINQPFTNHNGGQLQFGPLDSYLYVGMGDGGSGSDPLNHGQNKNTLLGALLRIDVDSAFPYSNPPDNPYVGVAGADEIWAIGLRNPWRFSFDRDTGDLFLGDVGQGTWEEIDFQEAGTPGGLNFGWVVREGPCPLSQVPPCAPASAAYTDPIAYHGRSDARSITGGFVYRGTSHPSLAGRYFYGDFITGKIWSLRKTGTSPSTWSAPAFELAAGFNISSFGEDEAGELLIVDYSGGSVRRVRPHDPPVITVPVPQTTLPGRDVSFTWDARQTPVQEWWIYAGATLGGREYYDSGTLGSSTSVTVGGLPTDGSTVHVRLWYRVLGLWRSSDFRYTAATVAPGTPAVTSPSPGSTLAGRSVLFEWTDNFAPVLEWWLYAGSAPGRNDYFDSRSLGLRTSVLVTGLPADGRVVSVRLWFRLLGSWQFVDASFTAATIGTPAITSPSAGTTLAGTTSFTWVANGESVAEWWLYAGSKLGSNDLHDSGTLGSSLTTVVSGLPTNGSMVHVRLWYRLGASWHFRDTAYATTVLVPSITAPPPGSVLPGTAVSFTWTANGRAVTEWWIYAGSTVGGREHFDSGSLGTSLQATVSNLPADDSMVFVRLWYRVAGLWQFSDFTYTAP
jgi:glucose/arabinose dehydrogenase